MIEYLITICWTAVCSIGWRPNRKTNHKIIIFFMFIAWGLVFALRYYVGTDFGNYYRQYGRLSTLDFGEYLATQRDIAFCLVAYLCNRVSNGNWYFFQIVVSALIYLPVLITVFRYGENPPVICLLYIFSMSFFEGYNGIRQSIAVSIMFYAYYNFFVQHKLLKYFAVTILAFLFHSSALLALPFVYLSTKELKSFQVKLIAVIMLLLYVVIWQIWPIIISLLRQIGQVKMAEDYAEVSHDKGSGLLRLLVYAVPFVIAVIKKPSIVHDDHLAENEIVLSLFTALFMLLSMRYWIFARVSQYFALSRLMLMPKLAKGFSKFSRHAFIILMLVLYFAYMIAMLLHGDGNFYPYATFP